MKLYGNYMQDFNNFLIKSYKIKYNNIRREDLISNRVIWEYVGNIWARNNATRGSQTSEITFV